MPRRARAAIEPLELRRLLSAAFTLDPTWGTGGFTTKPADTAALDAVDDLAVGADGSVVSIASGAGDQVIRYTAAGTVDNSFGISGRFILSFDANAIAVQPDGKILVAGNNTILRLKTNGDVDGDFGAGGILALDSAGAFITSAEDIVVNPTTGGITLLRSATVNGAGSAPEAVITHIKSTGNLDSAFAGSGTSVFRIPSLAAGITNLEALALTPDGQMLIGGTGLSFAQITVARVSDVGVVDGGFKINLATTIDTTLDAITADPTTGDTLLLTHTPIAVAGPTVTQFDSTGAQQGAFTIAPLHATDSATAIAARGGASVVVGFQPYAIARLASNQIAPGVFLGPDKILTVNGTLASDNILINRSNTQLRITRNGARTFVDRANVTGITIAGRDGDDALTVTVDIPTTVTGDAGNDTITTAGGNDVLSGGDGNDFLGAGGGKDVLLGGVGADQLYGGSGNDKLAGEGGKDRLFGGSGNDQIDGGAGDDKLYGESGNDKLFGGRGNDLLDGGSGDDQFFPGEGTDTVMS
jgi:uncharacterized delta-60 repeat protein